MFTSFRSEGVLWLLIPNFLTQIPLLNKEVLDKNEPTPGNILAWTAVILTMLFFNVWSVGGGLHRIEWCSLRLWYAALMMFSLMGIAVVNIFAIFVMIRRMCRIDSLVRAVAFQAGERPDRTPALLSHADDAHAGALGDIPHWSTSRIAVTRPDGLMSPP